MKSIIKQIAEKNRKQEAAESEAMKTEFNNPFNLK